MDDKNTKQPLIIIIRQLFSLTTALVISIFLPAKMTILQLVSLFLLIMLHVEGSQILIKKIHSRLSQNKHGYKHILLQIPLIALYSYILLITFNFLFLKIFHLIDEIRYIQGIFISVLFSFGITTVFEGMEFFNHWKAYIIRSEKMEKANLVAKYETLKKQIHPHFLFNGLNTLIGLIEDSDPKASEYAQKMSDFLKYLLTKQQREVITLREEIEVVRQYSFIQNVRFNNNIRVNIDIDNKLLERKLPPLSIQMLVENAIKHNIFSKKEPLIIDIKSMIGSRICIENKIRRRKNVESASVGLNNIKERYKYLNAEEPVISESDTIFKVTLAII